MNKLSYAFGLLAAQSFQAKTNVKEIQDFDDFVKGFKDHFNGAGLAISVEDANNELEAYFNKPSDDQIAGEKFLSENAQRPEVHVLSSGLQYEVLVEGTGRKPTATDTVTVHYEGTLIDGTVFDSSYKRGQTISFPLNGVIAGWTEGLQLMGIGSKYKLYIPYQLGYGAQGAPGAVPPYAAMIFTVELFDIK